MAQQVVVGLIQLGAIVVDETRQDLENSLLRRVRLEYREELMLHPHKLWPWFLRPCTVRILMVADSGIYFNGSDFGLSDLIGILNTPPGPYVRFRVTTAHRTTNDPGLLGDGMPGVHATIGHFAFTPPAFDPNEYDQVWLFGFESSSAGAGWPRPSDQELRAICEFMDAGKGVFATGDHGSLGSKLCGHVPRVRSMRLWFSGAGPLGEPAAPEMADPDRHDTLRAGDEFDNQSDDVPQRIEPVLRRRSAGYVLREVVWPHPLLCGPTGPIRVLPDHGHEGECIIPTDTTREFDFAGYHLVEYPPAVGGGPQPLPEIVAKSRVPAGVVYPGKDPTSPQQFGAISAYDGDLAGVGRVATDATWHHFLNINLTGGATLPAPWDQGFLATDAGEAHFEQIKSYFLNVALWLAPAASRTCMRRVALWYLIWDSRLIEAVTPGERLTLREARLIDLLGIGQHARDAIGRFAGQCQWLEWTLPFIKEFIPIEIFERLRPWPIDGPPEPPSPIPWISEEPLLDLALGGAVVALRDAFPEPDLDISEVERSADEIMRRGAYEALSRATESVDASIRQLDQLAAGLRDLGREERPGS